MCNSNAIAHDLRCRERPAGTTSLLIANWMDEALPVGPCIEVFGDSSDIESFWHSLEFFMTMDKTCSKEVASIIKVHALEELVDSCNPSGAFQGVVALMGSRVVDQSLGMGDWAWCCGISSSCCKQGGVDGFHGENKGHWQLLE